MSRLWRFAVVLSLLAGCALIVLAEPPARLSEQRRTPSQSALTVDNTTYINANNILMFVTNHGNLGRDLWGGIAMHGVFGNDYGTYYPYSSVENIRNGVDDRSVLYAAGLWIGGVDSATNDTLVTVSEYSSEYVPGPMEGGTYQTDRPEFRVYKLYQDSLEDNPNQDYLEWPVDQGAPVDGEGHPAIRGDQMLWTVYNDADPNKHIVAPGRTAPLGIEVQQTVWATAEAGDIALPTPRRLPVYGPADTTYDVRVDIKDYSALNGHDYIVMTDTSTAYGFVWHLVDVTTGDTLLANQTDFLGTSQTITDGFLVTIQGGYAFTSFEVVSNAAGPLDPPVPGALASAGFPTPGNADPDDNQQVGPARWAIHTGDDGGTSGGGTRAAYSTFLSRVTRDAMRKARIGGYDWEMRFTGSYTNPGVNGSWTFNALDNYDHSYWVPFELWRSRINTSDDPSDDLRLIPWIWGDLDGSGDDNFIFDLSQYGSALDATGHDGFEHSVSDSDDDPYTDWIYWRIPLDTTPGQAGYLEFEEAMKTDPANWLGNELPVIDRFVLVNWDGGVTPPFNQDLPEQGTVFRLRAQQPVPGLTYAFSAEQAPIRMTGPLGLSIYLKYKLINKGTRSLKDCFVSIWSDPDLGGAGDDYVGCDSLHNRFYCYNAWFPDRLYGTAAPAMGFKLLEGPVVVSPGDTAHVDGQPLPEHRNLNMYSYNGWPADLDIDNHTQAYQCMMGLDPWNRGLPWVYNGDTTRYVHSGDPVTGTGWLDIAPDDRHMMASFGPFDFRPGDTQQVILKFAVGQGPDRISSLASLYEILEYNPDITNVDDANPARLPLEFTVHQNYPNPFNPATVLRYSLPARADVEVAVFNVLGQKVVTLTSESQAAGEHAVVWNGTDASGRAMASGVYFYRVRAGEDVQTKKMMLLK